MFFFLCKQFYKTIRKMYIVGQHFPFKIVDLFILVTQTANILILTNVSNCSTKIKVFL